MFSLMLHKLLHKKWMVFCLLIGNILLTAVAVSYPIYRVSSFQKMLTDEFKQCEEDNQKWPAIFSVKYTTIKGGGEIGFSTMEAESYAANEKLGVAVTDTVVTYGLASQKAEAANARDGVEEKRITVAAISGLEEHVEMLYGVTPAEEITTDGFVEVMVSDDAMIEQDILIGDEYTFDLYTLSNGDALKIRVVGVFRILDESDVYWQPVEGNMEKQVMISDTTFASLFLGEGVETMYSLNGSWNFVWDYESIKTGDVDRILDTLSDLERSKTLGGRIVEGEYKELLADYSSKSNRIEATLLILQIPVLLLLCAFLYMIAGQMLQMEQNEISLMRSRGASKGQILSLYLMQSVFLGAISLIPGIPLGALCCKMLGSSTAFLEFSSTRSLSLIFTTDIIFYAVAALLVSVIMTTTPVISYSGVSIVNLKQRRSRQKKTWWKRIYLDVILLAVSLYGYYSFSRSSDRMMEDVLMGRSLDPLLYVSFSVFILGAGLFCARLQPLLLKAFYGIFKNHVKPSTYASVLSSIRTGAKQEFIILFMILTVAIGISNTTIARTIVSNAVNNTRHIMGADITLQEKWSSNRAAVMRDPSLPLSYTEPEFSKWQAIPGVVSATPVIVDEKATMPKTSIGLTEVTVMGIKTQGFAKVTTMQDGLLPYSYADYLNVMAAEPEAVIVSENFMTKLGMKLGDTVVYNNADGKSAVGYIYGFFTEWPTYNPTEYEVADDGSIKASDNYMVVANMSYLKDKWGAYPYEVWLDVNDGGEGLYQWISEQSSLFSLTKLEDMSMKEGEIIRDTMFQGTNGILSMSFIVILLLCCVGYLIYWIMSIRSRELLFGVLRAMGMRKKEITWLLIVEQICSGLFAIVAGGVIGIISSRMFVPMIQQAYAASEQVLPLNLITETRDLVQLFAIIGAMLLVCLFVLARIVSKMNISSALKLGED